MRDPAWSPRRLPAGARVTLELTHDEDLAAAPAAWVYPDNDGASKVQLDSANIVLTGTRTYTVTIPETLTADWAGTRRTVEVWIAATFKPIARGELEFYEGGGP